MTAFNTTIFDTPPVKFTEEAIKEVKQLRYEKDVPQDHILRIGVKGGGCSGMTYVLGFDAPKEDDMLFNMGGQHMMRDRYQKQILDWTIANKIETTEVDCEKFIFIKILTGDKSDNIPSVVTWQKEMKGGKLRSYSITDKLATKIYDQFIKEGETFKIDYLFSEEQKDRLVDIIYRVVGRTTVNLIKNSLTNNIALMLLHNRTIPDSIQRAIYSAIEKDWEGALDSIEVVQDMEKILEGTHWLDGKSSYAPDPFAGMDIPKEKKAKPMKLVGKKTNKKSNEEPTKKLF